MVVVVAVVFLVSLLLFSLVVLAQPIHLGEAGAVLWWPSRATQSMQQM